MKIKAATEEDRNKWQKHTKHAWSSYQWDWQQPMQRIGWKRNSLFIYDDKNQLLGLMPLYSKEKRFFWKKVKYFASSANSFGGIFYLRQPSKEELGKIMQKVKRYVRNNKGLFLDINTHPIINPQTYRGKPYFKHTFILNLSASEDDLWKQLNKKNRTAIRKAQKSGISTRPVETIDDFDKFYNLHIKTYSRTGAKVRPYEYFKQFFDCKLSKFYLAIKDDKTIAANMIVGDKLVAVYGAGASDYEYSEYCANNLLLWNAILDAKSNGYKYFDFSNVAHPKRSQKEEGIYRFKKSFGGEFIPKKTTRIYTSFSAKLLHKWLKN